MLSAPAMLVVVLLRTLAQPSMFSIATGSSSQAGANGSMSLASFRATPSDQGTEIAPWMASTSPSPVASTALFVVVSIFCAWLCTRFAPGRAARHVLWFFAIGEVMGLAATIPNWSKGWPHWYWLSWLLSWPVSCWIGLSYLLGIYFRHFANFNKTYGTLGAAIALMVWLYWTGFAMLVGAELNSELAKISREGRIEEKHEPPPITKIDFAA